MCILSSFLDINPNTEDNNFEKINIIINNVFESNEIEDIYNKKNNHLGHFIKGLSFIKETSGTKILYFYNNKKNYNNNTNLNNNNKYSKPYRKPEVYYKDPYTERNFYKSKEPIQVEDTKKVTKIKIFSEVNAVFEIKETEISDVYELYLLKYNKNTKSVKLKKTSIAYIPTADCSNMCRNIFKNKKDNTRILINCSYNFDKKKWVPCSLANDVKRPEFIHKVNKKLKL